MLSRVATTACIFVGMESMCNTAGANLSCGGMNEFLETIRVHSRKKTTTAHCKNTDLAAHLNGLSKPVTVSHQAAGKCELWIQICKGVLTRGD